MSFCFLRHSFSSWQSSNVDTHVSVVSQYENQSWEDIALNLHEGSVSGLPLSLHQWPQGLWLTVLQTSLCLCHSQLTEATCQLYDRVMSPVPLLGDNLSSGFFLSFLHYFIQNNLSVVVKICTFSHCRWKKKALSTLIWIHKIFVQREIFIVWGVIDPQNACKQ